MTPVYLTPQQSDLVSRCKALNQTIDADDLHDDPKYIEQARHLIRESADANIPTVAFVGLQLYVSRHDRSERRTDN